ncbi:SGNH/GDSL hydrolase family protein [Nocardiopsis sp. EMB25]|uniref:SGNH/GDSL hydrolase family protein n=1 Tax=Nocardiopsis sp. EMB25 TaxID=2835867 RepID=UPI002283D1A0|nr:SGNH/GDSL hydrolase family protein [Nocardiopsis sp. EMB25]MCY9782593.1 SGNH/GDSL hydrolase family protein [Nocardiopsis sp. EMB25]
MPARGDHPSTPEHREPDGETTASPAEPDEPTEDVGGSGADGRAAQAERTGPGDDEPRPRGTRRQRRARVVLITAAVLVVTLVVTLVVPASRSGLLQLWCEATGGVCPTEELPPITEDEEVDWRVRLEPREAALWGNYVALGDSYSSGDGAGDYDPSTAEPGGCWRSEHAYPRVIAEEFSFTGALAFYACSSHKGADMLAEIGTPESQLERVTEHTSLVTVGIGGNDLGFIPVLRTCIVRMPLLESGVCTAQEDEILERMDRFEETLTEILGEVRDRAPDARILVLGYPRLFPEEPPSMYYTLTTSDQTWLNSVGERFNDRIRDVVYRVDGQIYGGRDVGSVEYVNVFSALTGFEVSAENAWLNGIVLGRLGEGVRVDRASFHPTAQGQLSIAERVRLQIEEGPERALYVAQETLDNVNEDLLAAELGGPYDRPGASASDAPSPGGDGDGEETGAPAADD